MVYSQRLCSLHVVLQKPKFSWLCVSVFLRRWQGSIWVWCTCITLSCQLWDMLACLYLRFQIGRAMDCSLTLTARPIKSCWLVMWLQGPSSHFWQFKTPDSTMVTAHWYSKVVIFHYTSHNSSFLPCGWPFSEYESTSRVIFEHQEWRSGSWVHCCNIEWPKFCSIELAILKDEENKLTVWKRIPQYQPIKALLVMCIGQVCNPVLILVWKLQCNS